MRTFIISLATLLTLVPITASAFNPDGRVALVPTQEGPYQAGTIEYDFEMIDANTTKPLADSDLAVFSEKKLHMFVYDPALKNLQHIHPNYVGGVWRVEFAMPQNGNFWVWANGHLASDGAEFFASSRLMVAGGTPQEVSAPDLTEKRTGIDGVSQATVSDDRLVAGQMAMLTVSFAHTDGSSPQITPWLGEMAHAIIVTEDAGEMIHAHAMQVGTSQTLMIHVTFPAAGSFRIWLQFQDGGMIRTVPLAVTVFAP